VKIFNPKPKSENFQGGINSNPKKSESKKIFTKFSYFFESENFSKSKND